MITKTDALHRYQVFSIVAVGCAVVLIVSFGGFAITINAFPESGAADFFKENEAWLFRFQAFATIGLVSYLILLKLPRGFFRDPQIAASLNDERTGENSARAYRNAFYAVLLCQGIAGLILANSTSAYAVWMLALTTLLTAIVTYLVSYVAYERI